jgi:hypothetical protein
MNDRVQGQFKDRNFVGKSIVLDGSAFTGCAFAKCSMIYSGGEIPELSGCRFDDCAWQFGGEAANTIGFLSGMYQGGFDRLIESTFHEIRRGAMISQTTAPKPGPEAASAAEKFLKPLRIFRVPKQEPSS